MDRRRPPVHDPAGTAVALGLAVLGGAVVWQAQRFSTLGQVFPVAIGGAMVVLCLLLVARNVAAGRRPPPEAPDRAAAGADAPARGAAWRRATLVAVMAAWVALLPVLGFLAASLLGYLGAMAVAVHDRIGRREGVVLAAAVALFPLGFWLLMVEVLRIPVPRGLLF